MVTTQQLVAAVCAAVKALKERGGTNIQGISAYVTALFNRSKQVKTGQIQKAVKAAVHKDLLKETRKGTYRLNVNDMAKKDIKTIERVNNGTTIINAKCGCRSTRRRRHKSRKRCITRRRRSRHRSRRRKSRCRSRRRRSKRRKSRCRSKRRRSRRRKSRCRSRRRRSRRRRHRRCVSRRRSKSRRHRRRSRKSKCRC